MHINLEIASKWPVPNYVDPVRRGPELWIVSIIMLVLCTIAVGTRLYSRIFIRHWIGADDALVIAAYISTVAVSAVVFYGNARLQWDRHAYDMRLDDVVPALKALYASKMLWAASSSFTRLSLLCLFYRLLDHCQLRQYRWILHSITSFVIGLFILQLALCTLQCRPVSAIWSFPERPGEVCLDQLPLQMSTAVLNTFGELVVAVLPFFVVSRLRMDNKQKWNVISLLSLGIFVTMIGCVRCYFLFMTIWTADPNWWSTPHWICSELEIDSALICACAPALRPRIVSLWRRYKKSQNNAPKPTKRITSDTGDTKLTSAKDPEDMPTWGTTVFRTIDLEGIAIDGLGYTVRISGPFCKKKKKSARKEEWMASMTRKGSSAENLGISSQASQKQPVEIVTEKSFEVRESFHENILDENSWRFWAMSQQRSNEEDMDIEIERAGAGLNDWSLLDNLPTPQSPASPPDERRDGSLEGPPRISITHQYSPPRNVESRPQGATTHPPTPEIPRPPPLATSPPRSPRRTSSITRPLNSCRLLDTNHGRAP
ncbi:hypothetical protein EJ06DRAFT_316167 [Trichodelitschia bisporula]|uniref:Rhodopsin domain-containing protein n=1 Tax=Trichodelitschia bisporula TaxID=703511 RepID=A0A6G1I4S9_9PEZI|nr:hypothetical protein EJ06DRAFT_316167 [Trichodelitschia bisporula]